MCSAETHVRSITTTRSHPTGKYAPSCTTISPGALAIPRTCSLSPLHERSLFARAAIRESKRKHSVSGSVAKKFCVGRRGRRGCGLLLRSSHHQSDAAIQCGGWMAHAESAPFSGGSHVPALPPPGSSPPSSRTETGSDRPRTQRRCAGWVRPTAPGSAAVQQRNAGGGVRERIINGLGRLSPTPPHCAACRPRRHATPPTEERDE